MGRTKLLSRCFDPPSMDPVAPPALVKEEKLDIAMEQTHYSDSDDSEELCRVGEIRAVGDFVPGDELHSEEQVRKSGRHSRLPEHLKRDYQTVCGAKQHLSSKRPQEKKRSPLSGAAKAQNELERAQAQTVNEAATESATAEAGMQNLRMWLKNSYGWDQALDGWTCKVVSRCHPSGRAKAESNSLTQFDRYWHSPSGKKFCSRSEVAKHLGLKPPPCRKKPQPTPKGTIARTSFPHNAQFHKVQSMAVRGTSKPKKGTTRKPQSSRGRHTHSSTAAQTTMSKKATVANPRGAAKAEPQHALAATPNRTHEAAPSLAVPLTHAPTPVEKCTRPSDEPVATTPSAPAATPDCKPSTTANTHVPMPQLVSVRTSELATGARPLSAPVATTYAPVATRMQMAASVAEASECPSKQTPATPLITADPQDVPTQGAMSDVQIMNEAMVMLGEQTSDTVELRMMEGGMEQLIRERPDRIKKIWMLSDGTLVLLQELGARGV